MDDIYEFDRIVPRRTCGSEKWDMSRNEAGVLPEGVVPLSVADMEFRSPAPVRQALARLAEFGMWGYSQPTKGCIDALQDWYRRRHHWEVEAHWLIHTNNVVSALGGAVRAMTQPGDKVIIQTPVYPPFYRVVQDNGRTLLENPLRRDGMHYEMDLELLAQQAREARLLLLCSPHNPVGRVWSRAELAGLARICLDNGVTVVADEIHGDLIQPEFSHISYGTLGEEYAQNAVICVSASKSFSFAGLACATAIIPNGRLRERFLAQRNRDGFGTESIFGMAAMEAAYRSCEDWFDAMLAYVKDNYTCVKEFLASRFPGAGLGELQGTYLAWVDLSCLGLEADELMRFLRDEAALFVNDGRTFGKGHEGFIRINLACPRQVLQDALERLRRAADQRGL